VAPRERAETGEAFRPSDDQDWIQARYAEAQQLARIGSWEIDLETSSAEWSPGLRALVGLGPDDPPLDFAAYQARVHEDDRDRGEDAMVRLLRDGRPFDSDHRFTRLDGALRHFHAHARAELGPEGRVRRAYGTIQDVTDLRRAEEELRSERDLSAAVIGAIRDGYVVTREGVVTDTNDELLRITGFSREEIIGSRAPFPFWPPDALDEIFAMRDAILSARGGEFEITLMRKDGERFAAECATRPARYEGGELVGWLTSIRDVSGERRAATFRDVRRQIGETLARHATLELALPAILEELGTGLGLVTVGFWRRDGHGGWRCAHGWPAGATPHPPEGAHAVPIGAGEGPRALLVLERWEGRQPDDLLEDMLAAVSELLGQVLARDDSAAELERLKEEFLASVSHEFRTPLTSIRGFVELLLAGGPGPLTERQERYLGFVDSAGVRLGRLVDDLLLVAQVDAGRFSIAPGAADLPALVRTCVELLQPMADERRIELVAVSDPLEPMEGDAIRLGQLLDNLVSNALKFTEPGGRVDVRVTAARGLAVIEVADTGMGIPEAEQPNLFDRFARTAAAAQRGIEGTGLGLVLARAVAEAHGGQVSFRSAEGQGTTFRVELPRRAPRTP
jgi:PAS domain S-box-containing protein